MTNYEISKKIGAKKCADIVDSRASTVATGCPACIMQLKEQLANKGREDIAVKHVIELYADALK